MTDGIQILNILADGLDVLIDKDDPCNYCDADPCGKIACPQCGDVYSKCDFWLKEKQKCFICEVRRVRCKSAKGRKWKGPGFCKWCFSPIRLPHLRNRRRDEDVWPNNWYHKNCWMECVELEEEQSDDGESPADNIDHMKQS
jgi:hypothetical protein